MPRTFEQQRGINFEQKIADKLGGRTTPGSGNKFYLKSDVEANGLLVSCKSEKGMKWSKIRNQLGEAIEYAHGTGNIPALALQDIDYVDEFIVMKITDFVKAFSSEIKIPDHSDSPGIAKRKTAEVPLMLR